jgi:hypothetical protein
MNNAERAFIRHMLMYVLAVKEWEFEVDNQSEMTFILGNREIETVNMSAEELQEILNQVIRW